MSTTIHLSNNQQAVLRDPADVPVRLRRPVEKAMLKVSQGQAGAALQSAPSDLTDAQKAAEVASNLDPNVLDTFNELNDVLILARLQSWTLPVDISVDTILDLPQADYELLQKAVVDQVTEMMPNFGLDTDSDSPGQPSNV